MNIKIDHDVVLRHVKVEDAETVFQAIDRQREYLSKWLPFIYYTESVEDTREFLESVVNVPVDIREHVFAFWVNEQFGGLIGFKDTDYINQKTEIGYWLCEEFQGRGLVTTAVKELCKLAFEKLDMNRVKIRCAVGNFKSSDIPVRLGFVYEGIERDGEINYDGSYRDLEVYSMLKKEFK